MLRNFIRESWPQLLPVMVGFVAVYWLLPQARRSRPVWGMLAGGLALVLAGTLLIHVEDNLAEAILFYAFSGLAVLAAAWMLAQKNPVHAALAFALVVLSTCGLFLLQGAPFLMAATVVVYAGAIVVTFLFVIMLAQQQGQSGADVRSREPLLASLAGFVLLAAIVGVLQRSYDTTKMDRLLLKVQELTHVEAKADVDRLMGKEAEGQSELVRALEEMFGDIPVIANLDARRQNPANLRKVAEAVLAECTLVRNGHGSLTPDAALPLSRLSGQSANAPPAPAGTERLPAANVAGLGKSLFTDYLIPVQLAGMLLLVATIGAIVIAGRRPEGLR